MKKVYFLIPIVGCLAFAGLYWNFLSHHAEKEKAKQVAIEKEKKEKAAREIADREKAYADAIALAEKRKKEKEAREEKTRLDAEARQALLDEREKAYREQERQASQVKRLNDEIKVEKEAVAKIKDLIKGYQAEIDAQQVYVKQAQANEKAFELILTKIDAADKAAEAAAAAAAAAAKNKS
jgi:colicin import membrane protein